MKFTIRKKLMTSFFLIAILFSIASFVSYNNSKEINSSYIYLTDVISQLKEISLQIEGAANAKNSYLFAYVLSGNTDMVERINVANNQIGSLIDEGRELATLQETIGLLDTIEQLNKIYNERVLDVVEIYKTDKENAIDTAVYDIIPLGNSLTNFTNDLSEWVDGIEASTKIEIAQQADRASSIVIIISLFAVALAIVSGFLISNLIAKPIVKLSGMANEVAQGNLAINKLQLTNRDEIYDLNESFNMMNSNLQNMISQITGNSQHVATSSEQLMVSSEETSKATEQITESIQAIATGAEQQVKTISHVNDVVIEISNGIGQISSNIEVVSASASTSEGKAKNGKKVIESTIKQMNMINDKTGEIFNFVIQLGNKSEEIGKITSLITDVAKQTNLLALNAAIEAARAGEHGKGFAVVAGEVGRLAEQSNVAANQINKLINDIHQDIKTSVSTMGEGRALVIEGLTYVDEAGNEFNDITVSINDISKQIQEVSASVQEISAGTETMLLSITDALKISENSAVNAETVAASAEEQNASMEQIASAASTLMEMAGELQKTVNKFKI